MGNALISNILIISITLHLYYIMLFIIKLHFLAALYNHAALYISDIMLHFIYQISCCTLYIRYHAALYISDIMLHFIYQRYHAALYISDIMLHFIYQRYHAALYISDIMLHFIYQVIRYNYITLFKINVMLHVIYHVI